MRQDIYDTLKREFSSSDPDIDISIILFHEQLGIWECKLERGDRHCSVMCWGLGYSVTFHDKTLGEVSEEAKQKEVMIAAVKGWFQEQTSKEVFRRFDFTEKRRSVLEVARAEVTQVCPELSQYAQELQDDYSELWFRSKDRACSVNYARGHDLFTAMFYWDESGVADVRTKTFDKLAFVMKGWLHDYAKPSELKKAFPWFDFDKLAIYYEEGRRVEGDFVSSWDGIEYFYEHSIVAQHGLKFKPKVMKLIAQMRQQGYDETLRAGQSLFSFILSRSRRHRLRPEQPRIVFGFHDNNKMDVYVRIDREEKLSFPDIALTPEVEALLKRLEAKDID